MSKDSLIKGTIILAGAAMIARMLGIAQRVPMKHMLGDIGSGTYGAANNIYLMLLVVATAGIPSTLSKMVSERIALGREQEAKKIYRAAIGFAIIIGVIMAGLLYIVAPYYAVHIAEIPDAVWAIRALAPALLLFPVIAMMRGYCQGRQMMMPGGLSQIVEQIVRVLFAIGLAYLILQLGYGIKWAAAGASFGGVLGGVGALAVMLYYMRAIKRTGQAEASKASLLEPQATISYKSIYGSIFAMSIPIVLISVIVPAINFIDSSLVVSLLQDDIGRTAAREMLGILTNRAQALAGIPPILAIALSQSIVPIVSAAYARNDLQEVSRQAAQALRISLLTGIPFVIALVAAAGPINGLLFADTKGTDVIALLTLSTIFQITMMTSAAILMGLGQMKRPMVHVLVGLVVKIAATYALAPLFGANGIVLATMACFAIVTMLNLSALKRTVQVALLGRRWTGFIITLVVLAGCGYGLELLGETYISFGLGWLNYLLQGAVIGLVILLLYPFLLIRLRVVQIADLSNYPPRLQSLLRKAFKLAGVSTATKAAID